ncbi:hypothetical protein B0A55_01630 [Friedmanniomyces simplex]|uniref:Uncharacterized protein n=1 Tax=Friedmanniomyces simplex TaxID=329884 RepID=A0A4U0XWV5_9PEZI|nr:hypothetical protein B0A55_01630 [Friedmanniomyces simplex]
MSYPNRFTIPQGNYPGQPYAGADLCTANSDNASPSDFEDEIEIARDYPPQSYWRDFEDGRLHALRTNRGYAMGDLAPFMDMMHLQSPSSYTRPSESYNRPGTVPLRGQDTAKQGPSFVGSDLSAHWAAHESQLAQAHARAFPGPSPGFQMDFSRMEQSVPGHNIAPRASQTAPGMPGGTNIPPSNAAAGSGPEIAGYAACQYAYGAPGHHPFQQPVQLPPVSNQAYGQANAVPAFEGPPAVGTRGFRGPGRSGRRGW